LFYTESTMKELISKILLELGEDPEREGIAGTPSRVESSLRYLTSGYRENISDVLNEALFKVDYDEMVIVRDIEVYSLCEHHLLPFFGRCHVGYLPRSHVIGLSKIPRIVDLFAKRLQVQERLTKQIADLIMEHLKPLGVMVVIEAEHMCMSMRGAKKPKSITVTSALRGSFRTHSATRSEAMTLIRGGMIGGKEV